MTSPSLDLATLDLTRRLAAGVDLETALEQVEVASQSNERSIQARQYAQAQQRLKDAAEAAVREK